MKTFKICLLAYSLDIFVFFLPRLLNFFFIKINIKFINKNEKIEIIVSLKQGKLMILLRS